MPIGWVIAYVVLWGVVLAQMVVIFKLIKELKEFLGRIQSVPGVNMKRDLTSGSPVPTLNIKDQKGNHLRLGPNMEKDTLLLFASSSCQICKRLISSFDQSPINFNLHKVIVIISDKTIDETYLSILTELNISYVIDKKLFNKFFVSRSPYIIAINKNGIVSEGKLVQSWDDAKTIKTVQKHVG